MAEGTVRQRSIIGPRGGEGMIGIVRVLTTEDADVLAAHGRQIEARYGVPTRTVCIPDQPRGIYDEETERQAVPKILEAVRRLADEGVGAIFISCAADPAVREARSLVRIPVVGAGSAAAGVALALGERVGVLNLTEATPGPVRAILGPRLVGEAAPEGVRDATDLLGEAGQRAALQAAERLVRTSGADAVLLACTGYATVGMAARLRERLGVQVVDPVDAGGAVAVAALVGRR